MGPHVSGMPVSHNMQANMHACCSLCSLSITHLAFLAESSAFKAQLTLLLHCRRLLDMRFTGPPHLSRTFDRVVPNSNDRHLLLASAHSYSGLDWAPTQVVPL